MKSKIIGQYQICDLIGVGTTGIVKLGINIRTKEKVAIKIIKKKGLIENPYIVSKIQREVCLMKIIDHPHILKCIDFYETERNLYLILEYAERGELFEILILNKSFNLGLAAKYFRELIYGLEYLHSTLICHRDLKPENILVTSDDSIKIADFGFAKFMRSNITSTSCGSPHYAAPELISGLPYDSFKSDIWSCGVVLYTMIVVCIFFIKKKKKKNLQVVKIFFFFF